MSFEINPVLAGKFDAPNFVAAQTNINIAAQGGNGGGIGGDTSDDAVDASSAAGDTAAVDSRRYTQFDRSVTQTASITDFSFSDFLDTINPLQHIPVVGSIYRAATGDTIKPFPRVAGDILYGAVFGGVSAVLGAVGGVADSVMESKTGMDIGGTVLAALFGSGDGSTQVADADKKSSASATQVADAGPLVAALPQAAPQIPVSVAALAGTTAVTSAPAATLPSTPADAASGTIPLAQAKAFPLKQPFGGVMAPASTQSQDMAIALSSASPGMRLGHTIYTGRLVNGPHPLSLTPTTVATNAAPATTATTATTVPAATAMAGASTTNITGTIASPSALPQALLDDIGALKALNQYKSVAGGAAPQAGSAVNITN